MKPLLRSLLTIAATSALSLFCYGGNPASGRTTNPDPATVYVVANQDLALPILNSVSFYLAQDTQLLFNTGLEIGGYGIQGGFFGTSRLTFVPSVSAPCMYASNAASNNIGTISLQNKEFVDVFAASDTDDGSANGVGIAVNSNYLYASFTTSNTIATFALNSGCGLTFLGDIPAVGLQGGAVAGMAVNGRILVVAYGDGSIQSFDVTGGIPVPHHDLQNSAAYGGYLAIGPMSTGALPSGVDITQDGRFALFGDISAGTTVEVSDISSGKITPTKFYTVGTGVDAGSIRLSPDQSLLYIANSEGGTVTAAFFNPTTGKITPGCTSPTLQGFNGRPWLGSVVTRDTTGTGNVLYVAEFGRDHLEIDHGPASQIGILTITSNGTSCTLTETATSPVSLATPGVLSIGVYPPRPF